MTGDGRRVRRVEETVRTHLAEAFRRHLDDDLLSGLVITTVEMPPDLSMARVGVRLLVDTDDPRVPTRVERRLAGVAGRLRRSLGRVLRMKKTPELRFSYDAGHHAEQRVNEVLEEIRLERESRSVDASGADFGEKGNGDGSDPSP